MHQPATLGSPTRLALRATVHCLTGCGIGEVSGWCWVPGLAGPT